MEHDELITAALERLEAARSVVRTRDAMQRDAANLTRSRQAHWDAIARASAAERAHACIEQRMAVAS